MGWNSSENRSKSQSAGGKFFKLSDDGDQARFVLLSEPQEVEKTGQTGPYVQFMVDIFTLAVGPADEEVWVGKAQQWDMGQSAFKALLATKRAIGLKKLYGSQLIVVRTGEARSMQTSYTIQADGPVGMEAEGAIADAGLALFAVPGAAPAGPPARSAPAAAAAPAAPTVAALEGGMVLATAPAELRVAFEAAWRDSDGHPAVQDALQVVYERCRGELTAKSAVVVAAGPPVVPARRAPSF